MKPVLKILSSGTFVLCKKAGWIELLLVCTVYHSTVERLFVFIIYQRKHFIILYLYLQALKFSLMTKKRPLILITNDDGVNAKGLHALIESLRPLGRLLVISSLESQSGMSHAITVRIPLHFEKVREEEDLEIYQCNGTPADCVKLAINQILKGKPDLIASGINHGSNASINVFYSGTMGAVIEGCLNGVPSVGFSLLDYTPNANFVVAKNYARNITSSIIRNGLPKDVCLNVNFPVVIDGALKGIKVCRQTMGVWVEEYEKRCTPHNSDYYWLTGSYQNFEPDAEDTDEWALNHNYISIVPLKIDLTAYESIDVIKSWEYE